MSTSQFHPIIREWFEARFQQPTEAQNEGWAAVAEGRHTLIAAPTGSGKTLAAFLTCIDRLVRQALENDLPDSTQVVYVSPLKALSNDIQKNLAGPLEQIALLAEERGTPLPEIRVGLRTGDTPQSERQKMAKKPPHILVTTPESLYILLTSGSGRRGLKGVNTLILDEIHAVADDKRGSHLALSVERLCALSEQQIVRIGLSATQKPIEEIARLLVGNDSIGADGKPDCTIVDTGHAREIDLALQLPQQELGPIASHELWGETLDAVARLVEAHDTTLVFVNTRRLVERVSHQLSSRLGEEAVVAHHGSLSRSTRLDAEEKLKTGQVKVCVATASLELGIDIGDVDLVCQIGSPRSIGVLLQRVGRSGHSVGGKPKGRLFPLTRDELAECVALSRAVRRRNLDALSIPPWPVDVLAQQVVATCAQEEWPEDDLFDLVRRAYPYKELPRAKFDQTIATLSEGYAPRLGRNGAFLHHDGVNGKLKGRRGAPLAAMTSGGAIPENADYDVIAEPEDTFVGTVNEDFAIESLKGDVFLLGNTAWKVRRVESGKMRVENAHGQPPTIPFWLGEAPGRTTELSDEITELREGIDGLLPDAGAAQEWVITESGVDVEASRQLVAYIEEGNRVLGVTPSKNKVVAERFFDESGGMQLVIHAPFGARINRAWGMALRKKICRNFDFELQAVATDDGLNFSLGPSLSMPVDEIFDYLKSGTIEEVLTQAVLQAPIFGTRWRWNATRALAILRHTTGKKVPAPLQRMRSDDLLAAVFPAQVACQDNAPVGDIEVPDHPLVFETMRDCLTEASDLEGCRTLLAGIETGEIEVYGRDTVQPSVFSHQILNAMPYAFLDDAPLEERRARAVPLRRALPDDARDLTQLDPDAITRESDNAWPRIRDVDELHDALLTLGVLPTGPAGLSKPMMEAFPILSWLEQLAAAGRAHRVEAEGGLSAWTAAERLGLVRVAYGSVSVSPEPRNALSHRSGEPNIGSREDAILSLVRGWVESIGPFTATELADILALPEGDVLYALGYLENEGVVLRGSYRPGVEGEEFCDRRILARIHRSTIESLRSHVEPVSPAAFIRFLLEWQHVAPEARLYGEGGLLSIVEKLQGFESAAGVMEEEILGTRVVEYSGALLDHLCLTGEIVWGRFSARNAVASGIASSSNRAAFSKFTPVSLALRESLDWLLPEDEISAEGTTGASREAIEYLANRGASFLSEIAASTKRLPSDVEEALWALAAAGVTTADGMEAIRQRLKGTKRPRRSTPSRRGIQHRRRGVSRWWLLDAADPVEDRTEVVARQLLLRYGILFPELLARETLTVNWRHLARVLRRLEARGEIRGGRFVSGFVGEQFALPEAAEAVRKWRDRQPDDNIIVVSACDPLNLAGILTPGPKIAALPGNRLAFHNGVPVGAMESGEFLPLLNPTNSQPHRSAQERVKILLSVPVSHANFRLEQQSLATA